MGLTTSPSSSQTSLHGKGSGSLTDGTPGGCGGKGNGGFSPIYVTPYGTKFHTQLSCRSLMRSQNLAPSTWCRSCMRENEDVNARDWAIVAGPGETAHVDAVCPHVTGRRVFRKCGLCNDLERLR